MATLGTVTRQAVQELGQWDKKGETGAALAAGGQPRISPGTRQTRQRLRPRFSLPCHPPGTSELRQGGFQERDAEIRFYSLRGKRNELEAALEGCLQEHQRFLLREMLQDLVQLKQSVARVQEEITKRMAPYEQILQRFRSDKGCESPHDVAARVARTLGQKDGLHEAGARGSLRLFRARQTSKPNIGLPRTLMMCLSVYSGNIGQNRIADSPHCQMVAECSNCQKVVRDEQHAHVMLFGFSEHVR
jgi:hypothetical protein